MKTPHPPTRAGQLLALTAATLLVPGSFAQVSSVPVIPGAKGFGIMTQAGRGGTIIKVTNLNPSGAGSLRAALMTSGARTIIFDVSGTIELTEKITITHPNVTVAGQTAPEPGILVKGRGIVISANDVLFQHVAIRPGDGAPLAGQPNEPDNRDCLGISSDSGDTVQRVVVDHVSLSWSVDEVFTTWGSTHPTTGQRSYVKDCTISNSIFAEALNDSIHSKGPHPMGVLIGSDSSKISFYRNLLAHMKDRNPLLADDVTDVQLANNFIYAPGTSVSSRTKLEIGGNAGLSMVASLKGNDMVPLAGYSSGFAINIKERVGDHTPADFVHVYLDSNRLWKTSTSAWTPSPISNQTAIVHNEFLLVVPPETPPTETVYLATEPSVFTAATVNVPMLTAGTVETHVLANAGSRPANRNVTDSRIIGQVTTRTGSFIDTPPVLDVEAPGDTFTHNLSLLPSTSLDSDGDGYSDLEEWLHGKALEVEKGVPAPPLTLAATQGTTPNHINRIVLSWSSVPGAQGYRIERKKGLNGTYAHLVDKASTATSHNDDYLGTGTKYYYRVQAYNGNGDGGFSTDANATTAEVFNRQAHWKLDSSSGLTASDSSGHPANAGTLLNGPLWVTGKLNNGLQFDGANDAVDANSDGSLDNLAGITVAAWIKVSSIGASPARIVHKATGTDPVSGWQFCVQGTQQLGFAVDYATTDLVRTSTTNVFTLGGWHHVAVTWTGSSTATNVLMYVNGTAVGSYAVTTSGSGSRVNDGAANLYLGNDNSGNRPLNGTLDDVRVYNRALSLDEIRAVYRAGL